MATALGLSGSRFTLAGVRPAGVAPLENGDLAIAWLAWPSDTRVDLVVGRVDVYGNVLAGTDIIGSSQQASGAATRAMVNDVNLTAVSYRLLVAWQQSWDSSNVQPSIRDNLLSFGPTTSTSLGALNLGTGAGYSALSYGGHAEAALAVPSIVQVTGKANASNFAANLRDIHMVVLTTSALATSPVVASATISSTVADQWDPDVAAVGSGFVAVWSDESHAGSDGSGSAVRARVFTATGTATTGELQANTHTAGAQENASVAALAGGGFVVAWQERDTAGAAEADWGIRLQRFDAAGAKVGGEVVVNTTRAGDQKEPDVHGLDDGSFLVAWTDGSAVKGQYYDAAGAAVGGEFQVGNTARAGATVRITETPDGRILVTWDVAAVTSSNGIEAASATDAQYLDNRPRQINGTARSDVLVGRDSGHSLEHDILVGGGWGDSLFGLGGNDYLYGGTDNDVLWGGAGIDVLLGEAGNDTLYGGADQNYLFGGAGTNWLNAEGSVDVLVSEGLNDTLTGGAGITYHYGYGQGTTTARGGSGNDIFVMQGASSISGGNGQDYFYLSGQNDQMQGDAGVDVMLGGGGTDFYDGGAGVDYLFLGGGQDTVMMSYQRSETDVVNDFTPGVDKIRIYGAGIYNRFDQLALSDYGSFTIVGAGADTAVWLVGVRPAQLSASDFEFLGTDGKLIG